MDELRLSYDIELKFFHIWNSTFLSVFNKLVTLCQTVENLFASLWVSDQVKIEWNNLNFGFGHFDQFYPGLKLQKKKYVLCRTLLQKRIFPDSYFIFLYFCVPLISSFGLGYLVFWSSLNIPLSLVNRFPTFFCSRTPTQKKKNRVLPSDL